MEYRMGFGTVVESRLRKGAEMHGGQDGRLGCIIYVCRWMDVFRCATFVDQIWSL
jgi:hypothetical protein